MFIEVPYKVNDTVTLKLISGEEVVGRLTDATDAYFVLSKPMTFIMGPQGLGMVPYVFSANQEAKIKIKENAVVVAVKTDDQVAKQYLQQTSSLTLM